MPSAILLLVGAIAWMLYRRQASDGTLPGGLTVRGAQVAVTNVDAVERRQAWLYQGPKLWAWKERREDLPTQAMLSLFWAPDNYLELTPGRIYSHRVARARIVGRDPFLAYMVTRFDLADWDTWWAPQVLTVAEAQASNLIEVPDAMREPQAPTI